MGEEHSVFFDEWRACLRAHYIHVLRTGDAITEPTLRQVLLQTGASDEDLRALQVEALGASASAAEIAPEAPLAEALPLAADDELSDEPPYEEPAPDLGEEGEYTGESDAEDESGEEKEPPVPPDTWQLSLF
jgi:hypothetical protein